MQRSLQAQSTTRMVQTCGVRKLARLGGETSNTLADDLFETLEDWNTYLKCEKIDLPDLPELLPEAQKEQAKPLAQTRKQIRRPKP